MRYLSAIKVFISVLSLLTASLTMISRRKNIVCEVEGLGNIQTHEEDSLVCTDYIRIGRRLTWQEVLEL